MADFTHWLVTGFNVPLVGSPGLNPEWLEHRFDLFERFCFPSVHAQTSSDFQWIVYFDSRTPDEFKQRIARLATWDRFRPCYVETHDETMRPWPEILDTRTSHLITTTLDNDDAVATNFVARIQEQFAEQAFELVNFPNGYRLDLLREKLYRHRVSSNPFLSLIEKNDHPKTIRGCGPHDYIAGRFSMLRDVEREPLWIQVIHDRNIAATGLWGCHRVALVERAARFPVELSSHSTEESTLAIAAENIRRRIEALLAKPLSSQRRASLRKILRRKR